MDNLVPCPNSLLEQLKNTYKNNFKGFKLYFLFLLAIYNLCSGHKSLAILESYEKCTQTVETKLLVFACLTVTTAALTLIPSSSRKCMLSAVTFKICSTVHSFLNIY